MKTIVKDSHNFELAYLKKKKKKKKERKKNNLAVWRLCGLVLSQCFSLYYRHIVVHEALKNEWYVVQGLTSIPFFEILRADFCIIIYCVSTLSLYVECTDCIIVAKYIQHPHFVHHWLVLTSAYVSPTDATLTPDRVIAVMKDVKDWRRVNSHVYLNVPDPIIRRFADQYTTETEWSCAVGRWWVNTYPSPTWMKLALALYHKGEDRALEKVAQYLPKGTLMENVQTGSKPGSFH